MQHPATTESSLFYDGQLGQQYKIFLLNIFLGILTLGIYHYWGKTRVRRYTTASFSLLNDRFEYTGYGLDLFLGFMKAFSIVILLSLPFFYAVYIFDKVQPLQTMGQQIETKQSTYFISLAVIFIYLFLYYTYLPFVAVFGSLKYRVTQLRWRGIRGHMHGSTLLYGLVGFFHTILKLLTLGIWIPFADIMTYNYKIKRILFGNQQAIFTPQYKTLFIYHLLTFLAGALFALPICVGIYMILGSSQNKYDIEISVVIGILIIMAFRVWYSAAVARLRYNYLRIGNIGFHCTITGWALFKLQIVNLLILIFTLGFGSPLVLQRNMLFFCDHIRLLGDINQSAIIQASGKENRTGEGLSLLFDIDINLF